MKSTLLTFQKFINNRPTISSNDRKSKRLPKFTFLLLIVEALLIASCNNINQIEKLELSVDSTYENNIVLSWEVSSSSKFDSYELFRHSSSGINSETGTLVHVETEQSVNTYTDRNLSAKETYYYRLYHVNSKGKSKGSNVVSETTQVKELIENGSFETVVNSKPSSWNLVANEFGNPHNSIVIDGDASDGSNSLKIHHSDETGCYEQWISQKLDLDDLVASKKYIITFDYRANFSLTGLNIILNNSSIDIWDYISLNYQPSQSWERMTYEIVLPSNIGSNDPNFQIHFCQQGSHDIWLDNVSIKQAN